MEKCSFQCPLLFCNHLVEEERPGYFNVYLISTAHKNLNAEK